MVTFSFLEVLFCVLDIIKIARHSEHRDHAGCCIGYTSRRITFPVTASGSVRSPRLSTIFLLSRSVPIRFLHVRVNVLSFAKVIFAASCGVHTALPTVVCPLLSHHPSSVAKGFQAAQIPLSHVSLPSSPQLRELSLHLGDPNLGCSVKSVMSALWFVLRGHCLRAWPTITVHPIRSRPLSVLLPLPACIALLIYDRSMLHYQPQRPVLFWTQPIARPLLHPYEVPL